MIQVCTCSKKRRRIVRPECVCKAWGETTLCVTDTVNPRWHLADGNKVFERLDHLAVFNVQVARVPKVIDGLLPAAVGLALGQFIVICAADNA